ncbi:hypothetical protein ACQE98_13995 [Ornithinimicrobium sp. W1679]|uniref:hypothetical protein n=1 Tax=Ornithinimicrobium sp. W1679 TaxID=3418770 RepID=UPI003CE98AE4
MRSSTRTTGYAVAALEGVVALAGFGGGAAMMADPHGAMDLCPTMLDGSDG